MIDKTNVHLFSKHYKEADTETQAIAKFLLNGLVDYDKEEKAYMIILPPCKIKWDKKFVCSCGVEDCPHILALFMQLKIWNSEKKEESEKVKNTGTLEVI